MSKGGWARLIQQQQQDEGDHCQDQNSLKYKNINSKQQQQLQQLQLAADQMQNMNLHSCCINPAALSPGSTTTPSSTLGSTSAGTVRGSKLQFPLHDQGVIKAGKLLQILRKWRAQSTSHNSPHRPSTSKVARSSSCSKLGLMPLRCVTFSSYHLHSDDEDKDEGGDDDDCYASDPSGRKSMIARRGSSGRRHVSAPARTMSWPEASSSLTLCAPFPSMKAESDHDDGNYEELECLNLSPAASSLSAPLRFLSRTASSTPKGYLALYVGQERKRFLVKAILLNHPLFAILLDKAKQEFGFDQKGPLNIPCDIAFFQHIMLLVESKDPSYRNADHSSILLHFNSANLAATVM